MKNKTNDKDNPAPADVKNRKGAGKDEPLLITNGIEY